VSRDTSESPRYLPVGLDLQGKECLVIGGGSVGTRKAATLAHVGAIVTVVSPAVTEELKELIVAKRVRWLRETFRREHLFGIFLAVAATDDDALNADVVETAVRRGTLACDASSAQRSQLIFGALLESDDVTIGVFTGGRDPSRARRVRDRIAGLLGERWKSERER
jgi:siroheme synthase-like protein